MTQSFNALTLLEMETRSRHANKTKRIAALETWIAANYRDTAEDREKMGSFYSLITIPQHRRESLQMLLARPASNTNRIAPASEVDEEMIEKSSANAAIQFDFFVGLLTITILSRHRLIHDRLAGTYLVAR